MTAWIVVLSAAAVTYVLRASMLIALSGRTIGPRLTRWLELVAPSAIGALVALSTTRSHGSSTVSLLATVAVGFLAVRRSHRVVDALVVGFPVLWLLHALGV